MEENHIPKRILNSLEGRIGGRWWPGIGTHSLGVTLLMINAMVINCSFPSSHLVCIIVPVQ